MHIRRVRHITIAVRDVQQAAATFTALFGATGGGPRTLDAFAAKSLDADLAGTGVQFVAPADADSALTRFIERRGEGLYNIALEVDDLDAALAELRERDVRVSDPVEAAPGERSAFVAMAATHGVSVQLVEVGSAKREAGSETGLVEVGDPKSEEKPEAGSQKPDDAANPPPVRDLRPDEWEEWSDTD